MNTVSIDLLRTNVAFTLTMRKFSNSRKIKTSQIPSEMSQNADKSRIRASKVLLVSKELDAIHAALTDMYNWSIARSVPSFFKKGLYLVKLEMVPEFEAKLNECLTVTLPPLIRTLQECYQDQIKSARAELKDFFNGNDYPAETDLPKVFGLEWNWISFGVPENLPAELRATEATKLENQFKNAEQEIIAALREGFADAISHVTERLMVGPNEKPKTFKDTLFADLSEFIETFNARNLMNDEQLASMVEKAKAILANVRAGKPSEKAQLLRDSRFVRDETARAFAALKESVDASLADLPSRKFSLED